MKEFDIVHHHHHHQQQQQQQHHHPHHHQQHHQSWQQRQQHQTHTTSVYASSTNQQQLGPNHSQPAQRSSLGQHQQQQQNQHAAAQQYHHQQLQSTAHHNSAAAAAAYYQQQAAHLYPTYQAHAHSQQQDQQTQQQSQQQQTQSQQQQPQQQHSASDHSHHHVPVTGSAVAAVVSAAHGVVGQQQHGAPVHHQTPPTNTQAAASAALSHAGWSPSVGTMAPPQAHHAVVTDHSTLAYMTHAYQGHNTTVNDPHHRNSNGPMSTQPIGSGPQASSYTVDSLYNTTAAAAAAAVAAYGYNNYNAAFFQTSNNGPHNQTGHPTAANLSTFWNHNQTTQPRTAHSQAVNNQQATVQQQQRQPITSEQTANYIHDPRMYYGRQTAAYQPNQEVQNFGQTQHHTPPQQQQAQQPQADLIHHRMNALSQQQQILQHHEQQQLQQVAAHQQPQLHHSPIGNHQHHQSSSSQAQQTLLNQQHSMQHNALLTNQANTLNTHSTQNSRQLAPVNKVGSQDNQLQKQPSNELETLTTKPQVKNQLDYDQINLTSLSKTSQPINQLVQQPSQQPTNELDTNLTNNTQSSLNNVVKDSNQTQQQLQSKLGSLSPTSKPPNPQATLINKTDTSPSQHFQKKPQNNNVSQLQSRNLYRAPQQQQAQNDRDRDRMQVETTKRLSNNREVQPPTLTSGESKSHTSPASSSRGQQDSDQPNSLEDSMASLTVGSARKTTWASIASQPAKVAQPKSLKSKIAGSNSVLSSAKHLAAVSLDSSLESKNGINPAIKSSVSSAATSIQRSSVPPPVSKVPAGAAASLKLDLLSEESLESSRISWPAVNASINLTLDDPPLKESVNNYNNNSNTRPKKDEGYQPPSHRDYRDPLYKDHNQGGANSKMVNAYQPPHSRDSWNRNRSDQRDYRIRRDSDRRGETSDSEKQNDERNDNNRDSFGNSRRDYKPSGGARINSFRTGNGGEDRDQFRERDKDFNNKRGAMLDRGDHRSGDGYQNSRFSANNRYDSRDSHNILHNSQPPPVSTTKQNSAVDNHHQTQHHHYNNIRDGNTAGNSLSKFDLNLHPHLNPANFNPKTFDMEPVDARYFIIKSYSEDDIHRSIKYSIWCSTNHGNKRLDEAYRQQQAKNGPIYLFFSVNGSGHFCGMAQMMSSVDFDSSSGVWAQSKWQGEFSVNWLYVKDVPNSALRHITLENNEDKPVTNSRDTQEVPSEKGKAVLRIIHQYSHITSLFDDFLHYERRQEEEKLKKSHQQQQAEPIGNQNRSEDRDQQHQRVGTGRFGNRPFTRSTHNERASRFAT